MMQIGVFRVFGNELEQQVNDNEVALELHNNRSKALHEVFDHQQDITIYDWGQTDDWQPHEFITIAVSVGAIALTNHVLIPAAKYIFEKIADKTMDMLIEKSVSWVLSKFKKNQEEKKIGGFEIRLPNGAVLIADNPAQGTKVKFTVNGEWQEVEF